MNMGSPTTTKITLDDAAAEVQRAGYPDFVCIQEGYNNELWQQQLAQRLGYPYKYTGPVDDISMTLVLLSRHPLVNQDVRAFAARQLLASALTVEAEVNGARVRVVCTHLDPIPKRRDHDGVALFSPWETVSVLWTETLDETPRSRSVAELMKWLAGKPTMPTVIAGDFNTVFFSKAIRRMTSRYIDALFPSLEFFHGTYKDVAFPLKPRVDYIFHSQDIATTEARVLESPTGDHRAVMAQLLVPRS